MFDAMPLHMGLGLGLGLGFASGMPVSTIITGSAPVASNRASPTTPLATDGAAAAGQRAGTGTLAAGAGEQAASGTPGGSEKWPPGDLFADGGSDVQPPGVLFAGDTEQAPPGELPLYDEALENSWRYAEVRTSPGHGSNLAMAIAAAAFDACMAATAAAAATAVFDASIRVTAAAAVSAGSLPLCSVSLRVLLWKATGLGHPLLVAGCIPLSEVIKHTPQHTCIQPYTGNSVACTWSLVMHS